MTATGETCHSVDSKRQPFTKTQTASHAPPKTQAQAESVPAGESLALGIAPSCFV
jgi:hypothetical protein